MLQKQLKEEIELHAVLESALEKTSVESSNPSCLPHQVLDLFLVQFMLYGAGAYAVAALANSLSKKWKDLSGLRVVKLYKSHLCGLIVDATIQISCLHRPRSFFLILQFWKLQCQSLKKR